MKMKLQATRNRRQFGFTLVEIMVVIAIIGMLMGVATLGISHAIKSSKQNICNMNIEAIESAKEMWSLESKKGDNDTAGEDDLKVHLKNNLFPTCPSGGTYSINPNNVKATCSIHSTAATTP